MKVDVVIVGAGAAGCVLATRLSEDPSRRVLLVEAGPDYARPEHLPEDLVSGWGPTFTHDWGFEAEPDLGGLRRPVTRARVVGGCSATNATFALRGSPGDYDSWGDGWRWEDVLPYFRRLESDLDFGAEPWHGDDGPLPVRRYRPEELTGWQSGGLEALLAQGHPYVDDHNRPGATGAGPLPVNTVGGRRISAAEAYLAPARARPNLVIRPNALVDRILMRAQRAVGIQLDGEPVNAGCVVLSAGAYGTPAVLLRSGIGDPAHLAELGIETALELPGVGANLIDHPLCVLELPVQAPNPPGPRYQIIATWRSDATGDDGAYDMQYLISGPRQAVDESPTGWMGVISTALMKPRSRGRVRLRSRDPVTAPIIDLGLLSDEADLPRLTKGIQGCQALLETMPLTTPTNAASSGLGDHDPRQFAVAAASSYFHPVGTCRLGDDPHAGAVVDRHCRVHGAQRLWIADASVMPDIPAANTHLPTIMIAERTAQRLKNEDQ